MSEEVRGRVASANEAGIKLEGEEDWRNFTKKEWREKPFDKARAGDEVILVMSNDGEFVRSVAVNNGARAQDGPRPSASQREVYIARESAIKSAIELLSHDEDWLKAGLMDKQMTVRTVARNMHSLITSGFAEPTAPKPAPPPEPEPEPEPEPVPFE